MPDGDRRSDSFTIYIYLYVVLGIMPQRGDIITKSLIVSYPYHIQSIRLDERVGEDCTSQLTKSGPIKIEPKIKGLVVTDENRPILPKSQIWQYDNRNEAVNAHLITVSLL